MNIKDNDHGTCNWKMNAVIKIKKERKKETEENKKQTNQQTTGTKPKKNYKMNIIKPTVFHCSNNSSTTRFNISTFKGLCNTATAPACKKLLVPSSLTVPVTATIGAGNCLSNKIRQH